MSYTPYLQYLFVLKTAKHFYLKKGLKIKTAKHEQMYCNFKCNITP